MNDVRVRELPADKTLRCPYCHDDVEPGTAARCAACGAGHHATCVVEAAACGACSQAMEVAALAASDQDCPFHHDCGAKTVQGDSLCAKHRREVSLGARDLRPVRDEARALLSSVEGAARVASVVGGGGFTWLIYKLVGWSFGLPWWQSLLIAAGVVAVCAFVAERALRQVGRLRVLIDSIPDDALTPHPGTVRVSVKQPPEKLGMDRRDDPRVQGTPSSAEPGSTGVESGPAGAPARS